MKRFELGRALGGRARRVMTKKTAFTLAEVLITLGIIGVVAAMTLPTLIQQHQKQVYVTQLKKALSTVQNMVTKITADEGASDLYSTSLFDGLCGLGKENCSYDDGYGDPSVLDNIVPKYIKTVKTCSNGECNIEYGTISWPNDKYIISDSVMLPASGRLKGYYSNDGAIFYFGYVGYSGNHEIEPNSTGLLTCIDVNGEKGPNLKDRDLFCYTYCPNLGEKIVPGSKYICNMPYHAKDTKEYRLMTNGWKMDY